LRRHAHFYQYTLRSWPKYGGLRHDGDRTKLEPFRKMHRADRELAWRDLDPIAKFDRRASANMPAGAKRANPGSGRSPWKGQQPDKPEVKI
jgi:hypothetical protein